MRLFKRNVLKSSEIALGAAVVDLDTGRLRDRSGTEIALRNRSRDVLRCLLVHRNQVVTRPVLIAAAWHVSHVSDDNISQSIADIRRAIADTDKRILETIPGRGYRLVIPEPDAATQRARHRRLTRAAEAEIEKPGQAPVILVHPFENLCRNRRLPSEFRAVLTEAIVTALARYPELTVRTAGPASGRAHWSSTADANFSLTGSYMSDGTCVRVVIRLLVTHSGSCIWTEEFDFDLAELLTLTRLVGRRVAGFLGARLIDMAEARLDRGEISAMLIENAARSRMIRHRSAEALRRNIRDQQAALDRFPDAAWGHFGQALAYRTGIDAGWLPHDTDKAVELAQSHASRAIALAPENYLAHYAIGKTLMGMRQPARAVSAYERAGQLNPSSTMVLKGMINAHLHLGDLGAAQDCISQCRAIASGGDPELDYLDARQQWQSGETQSALNGLTTIATPTPESTKLTAILQAELGQIRQARQTLSDFAARHPGWTMADEAKLRQARGEPLDQAQRWMTGLSAAGMA
ncbi:winged helix-turn-helix domain-containing protein [Pseudooceanicola sp. C21-150M6]|uniref:winged helix-turn-helix domain-containing protein n=1 Tax=Pseudooceanicola sp. C21-150M6 TaxID=3434355 RepID=UPI003D7FE743